MFLRSLFLIASISMASLFSLEPAQKKDLELPKQERHWHLYTSTSAIPAPVPMPNIEVGVRYSGEYVGANLGIQGMFVEALVGHNLSIVHANGFVYLNPNSSSDYKHYLSLGVASPSDMPDLDLAVLGYGFEKHNVDKSGYWFFDAALFMDLERSAGLPIVKLGYAF